MSIDTHSPTPVIETPSELIALWRGQGEDIDNGTKPGSHLKATVLRICAAQLEGVAHTLQARHAVLIDTAQPAGFVEIDALPVGAIITNRQIFASRPIEPTAWVCVLDPVDDQKYWRGTHRSGVSLRTAELVHHHGPVFERFR